MKTLSYSLPVYVSAFLSVIVAAGAVGPASADEGSGQASPRPAQPQGEATAAAQYCESIADAAADARFQWQTKMLDDLQVQIEDRIAQLEAERTKYELWLERRQAFLEKAEEGVVAIYARMRPDAAAPQLAAFEPEIAAAVLAKLNPRTAGAILSEMDPTRAAQLTRAIAGPAAEE